jgi:O-antigen/teichoic acid export membrane protein
VRAIKKLQTLLAAHASSTPTRVGRVLAVVLLGAGLQIITQTLLARSLPKTQVGLISLLLGALPILTTLSMAGQGASTVRFLSRSAPGTYDSAAHARRILALVLPLGAVAALAGAGFYGLGWGLALVLVALVISQNTAVTVSSVLRAEHRYELAMTAMHLPAMAAAVVLIVLRLTGSLTYTTVVVTFGIAFLLSGCLIAVRGARTVRTGGKLVPRSVMREGLFLLGLNISFALMVSVDKLIIAKMLPYAELAVYASIFTVMRGFDFLFYSISYVLMPRVNVLQKVRLRQYNLLIAGLAGAVTVAYLILGDDVVSFLYEGRYDEGAFLILPFALSGIAKLFYSVPSSVIGGRLPRPALKQFLWFNLAAVVVNIVLDIIMIRAMGLMGAAIATAIAWGLRLAGGYVIIARNRGLLEARTEGTLER